MDSPAEFEEIEFSQSWCDLMQKLLNKVDPELIMEAKKGFNMKLTSKKGLKRMHYKVFFLIYYICGSISKSQYYEDHNPLLLA